MSFLPYPKSNGDDNGIYDEGHDNDDGDDENRDSGKGDDEADPFSPASRLQSSLVGRESLRESKFPEHS